MPGRSRRGGTLGKVCQRFGHRSLQLLVRHGRRFAPRSQQIRARMHLWREVRGDCPQPSPHSIAHDRTTDPAADGISDPGRLSGVAREPRHRDRPPAHPTTLSPQRGKHPRIAPRQLRAEVLAALEPAGSQDGAPGASGHAVPEPVPSSTSAVVRLVRALQSTRLLNAGRVERDPSASNPCGRENAVGAAEKRARTWRESVVTRT